MGLRTLKVGTKGLCQGKADKLVKEPLDLLSNSRPSFPKGGRVWLSPSGTGAQAEIRWP